MTIYICASATDACRKLAPDCIWGWGVNPVHMDYDSHTVRILKKSDEEGTKPLGCARFTSRNRQIVNFENFKKTRIFRESEMAITQED